MTEEEIGLEIAHEGGLEEFHQKKGDHYMYSYHKARRLALIEQLKKMREEKSQSQN